MNRYYIELKNGQILEIERESQKATGIRDFGRVFSKTGYIGTGEKTVKEWIEFLINKEITYEYKFITNSGLYFRPHDIKNIWTEDD